MATLRMEDMDRLVYLSVPELVPDGNGVVVTRKTASADSRSFPSSLITASFNGDTQSLLEQADRALFSPDGQHMAYLCDRSGESQIWIRDREGDRQLTTLVHGVTDYIWGPDSKTLYFTTRLWNEELEAPFTEMTPAEKAVWKKQKAQEPLVVEELIYKLDEVGLFDGSFSQIGQVTLDAEQRLLTRGAFEHTSPGISCDGSRLYYYATPFGSVHRLQPQLMVRSLHGEPVQTAETDTAEGWPCDPIPEDDGKLVLAPDPLLEGSAAPLPDPKDSDRVLVFSWVKTENGYLQLPMSVRVSTGEKTPFFASECPTEEINNAIVGRNMVGRETPVYRFSEDGEMLLFTAVWMGKQQLYAYDRASETFRTLTDLNGSVQAFSAEKKGRLALLIGTIESPAELYVLDIKSGHISAPLTHENEWLRELEIPVPVSLDVPSSDGKATIHGWYLKPVGLKENEKVPAVLDVHGGPDCSYSANFWFEFQYLASKGMAVVWCDPRGSVGYGAAHRSGDSAYGGEAACDLMQFLDTVCDLGFIDREHCGVTGGSYGGFMTNWLITNTDRFAAAVTQRTLSNLATSYGTGDMGFVTGKKPEPMSRMFKNRATSRSTAVRLVDRIETPLLLLHGVNDYRCSFEQSEQLYIAMKERRPSVPVRMVAFPGQNHGLTRSGQPWAQKAHLQEMADWFVRYLRETPHLSAKPAGPAWKDASTAPKSAAGIDPTSQDKEGKQ